MSRRALRAALPLCSLVLWAVSSFAQSPDTGVTADGMLVSPSAMLSRPSSGGRYSLRMIPVEVGFDQFRVDLEVTSSDGAVHRISGVSGNGFWVTDLGRVIVLRASELSSRPSALEIYALDGERIWTGSLDGPVNPAISGDGRFFACAVRHGTIVLDLADFTIASHPRLDRFAIGAGGLLAGVSDAEGDALVLRRGSETRRVPLDFRSRKVLVAEDGSGTYVLGPGALLRVPSGLGGAGTPVGEGGDGGKPVAPQVVYRAASGEELRDVRATASGLEIGIRRATDQGARGERLTLDAAGFLTGRYAGPGRANARRAAASPPEFRGIPWPIAPDAQHPVGNTYGEYQDYGGAPYPHPGFDVMGSPDQPVYAVRSGVVKAILTTSGEWHWRVAIGDSVTAATERGYLYAHLNEASITVNVGDGVLAGQQLGTLVTWPNDDFHHCHFTRIEDSGTTWDGYWLSVQNPHLDVNHTETSTPVFLPARGTSLLAFCTNNTSTYQNPTSLHGAVDIIARVYDQIATTWKCSVQELRYTIYPLGQPGAPVVNDKQSVFFNMTLDTYAAGTIDAFLIDLLYKQDSTCQTMGDYSLREFYHILTNSNGDQDYDQSDVAQAWNTALLPDGNYVVRVRAVDAAGNAKVDSMTVSTVNGNPSSIPATGITNRGVTVCPNPAIDRTILSFTRAAAGSASLSFFAPDGRRVRHLTSRPVAAGTVAEPWDLCDDRGVRLPAGTYYCRIEDGGPARTGRVTIVR